MSNSDQLVVKDSQTLLNFVIGEGGDISLIRCVRILRDFVAAYGEQGLGSFVRNRHLWEKFSPARTADKRVPVFWLCWMHRLECALREIVKQMSGLATLPLGSQISAFYGSRNEDYGYPGQKNRIFTRIHIDILYLLTVFVFDLRIYLSELRNSPVFDPWRLASPIGLVDISQRTIGSVQPNRSINIPGFAHSHGIIHKSNGEIEELKTPESTRSGDQNNQPEQEPADRRQEDINSGNYIDNEHHSSTNLLCPNSGTNTQARQKRSRDKRSNDDDDNDDDNNDDNDYSSFSKKSKRNHAVNNTTATSTFYTSRMKKPVLSSDPGPCLPGYNMQPNKTKGGKWSDAEHSLAEILIKDRRRRELADPSLQKLRDVKFWSLVSEGMKERGFNREYSACKNYWSRYGRERSKFEERISAPKNAPLVTSAQGKHAKRIKTLINYESYEEDQEEEDEEEEWGDA